MEKTNPTNSLSRKPKYAWYRDDKVLGTIILSSSIIFSIFTWIDIPFISSIPAYTTGMLFGYCNPLFYLFCIWVSLRMLIGDKVKLPSWVKLNATRYWLVFIGVIFISVSSGYYQSDTSWVSIGKEPWQTMDLWYERFTSSSSAWIPNMVNGGLIGVLFYSITASATSGIGSIVIAYLFLIVILSIFATGTIFGFYKDLFQRRKSLKTIEETKTMHLQGIQNNLAEKVNTTKLDDSQKTKPKINEDLSTITQPLNETKLKSSNFINAKNFISKVQKDKPKNEFENEIKEDE